MAFLDVLKREDGSWNIGLIMALDNRGNVAET